MAILPARLLLGVTRAVLRRELVPPRAMWWLAADGMDTWYRTLRHGLAEPLGSAANAERTLARIAARAYVRRYDLARAADPALPDRERDPRVVGLFVGALARCVVHRRTRFLLADVGGAPRTPGEHLRAQRLVARLSPRARWEEVATHLGEVLIALTEELPKTLTGANAVLGRICFDGGVRYGTQVQRAFALPDGPASAIEVLRIGEYIFRVNPEHWGEADVRAGDGWLEGTACPWFSAPGWQNVHCGIFGQFQAGVASVFGLRYHLTKTIPRHGGGTCRIDLRPIALRASAGGRALAT